MPASPAHLGQFGVLLVPCIDKYRDHFYNMIPAGVDKELDRLGYQIAFVKTLHEIGTIKRAAYLLDSFKIPGMILLNCAHVASFFSRL